MSNLHTLAQCYLGNFRSSKKLPRIRSRGQSDQKYRIICIPTDFGYAYRLTDEPRKTTDFSFILPKIPDFVILVVLLTKQSYNHFPNHLMH